MRIDQETVGSEIEERMSKAGGEISFEGGNGDSLENAVIVRGAAFDLIEISVPVLQK